MSFTNLRDLYSRVLKKDEIRHIPETSSPVIPVFNAGELFTSDMKNLNTSPGI